MAIFCPMTDRFKIGAAVILAGTLLGPAGWSHVNYRGNWEFSAWFNLAFIAMLALVFPRPRSFAYTFFAVFLFLGFWVKFTVHSILGNPFLEPIGMFDGSPQAWDRALAVASVTAVGVVLARCLHLFTSADLSRFSEFSPAPRWYGPLRIPLWVFSLFLLLTLNVLNLKYAFYQAGINAKLLLPFEPKTFYACGLNYAGHVREVAHKIGQPAVLPPNPDVGYRANNSLVAHGEAIVIPKDATEQVQYEGELVVVIGKKAKHLSEAEAMSCVFGYTIGNDVSERSWQKADRGLWRAKNTDSFAPMGPWIETELDLGKLFTKIRLNGNELIQFPTNDMIFGVVDFLVAMTRYLTLGPGDMVWMGTEGATENMKHGDVCDVEIVGIGTLSNPVIRAG